MSWPAKASDVVGLAWNTSSAVRCPSAIELGNSLRAHFGTRLALRRGAPVPGENGLYLGLGPGQGLYLWLWSEPAKHETARALSLDGATCSEKAAAVTLIVDGWLQELALPVLRPAAQRSESHESLGAPTAPSSTPPQASSVQATRSAARASGLAFEGRLGALLSMGLDTSEVQGGGAIAAELDFTRHWGVGLQVDLLADLRRTDPYYPGGSLLIARQAFTFYGTLRFEPTPAMALALLAGLRLQNIAAESEGYPATTRRDMLTAGPWIAALYELRIAGPLLAFGQVQFDATFSRTSYVVHDPPNTVAALYALPTTSLGLILGVTLRTD
jgi:hypothetical protein